MTIKPASDPSPGGARGGGASLGGYGGMDPPGKKENEQSPGRVRDGEVTSATFGYLGAIVLGPVIPLVVYAFWARRSPFMRYHAATAVNLSLTGTLYGVCCLILGALLLLDSITVALIVVIPVGFVIWVSMLRYLIRGVMAANRGDRYEVPNWICARFVNSGLGVSLALGRGISVRRPRLRARSACASPRRPADGRGG
jgi:uncharacterized Tic20 family protein